MYLNYFDYKNLGGTASEAAFPILSMKAEKRIDRVTSERVKGMAQVPQAVKLCMVSIINMQASVGAEAQAATPVVTSFNNDGYSESYGHSMGANDAEIQMNKLIGLMLYGVKDDNGIQLLYRGVRG